MSNNTAGGDKKEDKSWKYRKTGVGKRKKDTWVKREGNLEKMARGSNDRQSRQNSWGVKRRVEKGGQA